jgi:hypothetical protein
LKEDIVNNLSDDTPHNRIARIAGISYLLIIAAGIISQFAIRGSLITSDDAEATAQNIIDAETLFRLSIAGDIVMLTFDVIVGIALFLLFLSVSPGLTILATSFRIVHAAVYGATLLSLFVIVALVGGAGEPTSQEVSLIQTFADVHAYGYSLALIFFALSLLTIGYLVVKSSAVPRLIGFLLIFAGFGYLVDSFARVLLTNYDDFEAILGLVVFLPAFIGELSFALWLLAKGVVINQRPDALARDWVSVPANS